MEVTLRKGVERPCFDGWPQWLNRRDSRGRFSARHVRCDFDPDGKTVVSAVALVVLAKGVVPGSIVPGRFSE